MKLKLDYSCPHCGTTAVLRAGQVTVFHSSWCPRRSRNLARSPQQSAGRRGRCAVCGRRVPVAAGHRHEPRVPDDAMR